METKREGPLTANAQLKIPNKENTKIKNNKEDILEKRRQKRYEAKQERLKLYKQKLLENKLCPKSDKIKMVSAEFYENFSEISHSETPQKLKRNEKLNKPVNILDIINNVPVKIPLPKKRKAISKPFLRYKGKKREKPKKKFLNRLKKAIIKHRKLRKEQLENYKREQERNINKFENISLFDVQKESIPLREQKCNTTASVNKYENIKKQEPEKTIHSRRFRRYCDNCTSKDLLDLVKYLLSEIHRFQKRAYEKNEIKARAHNRYVCGFKEVQRKLEISKIKLLIIATDCEDCSLPDGINETIEHMKKKCQENEILYIFALERRQLGYLIHKKSLVSCVGILNCDGLQQTISTLIECVQKERENYINLTSK